MIEIEVKTPSREALVNVTGLLEAALPELGLVDGLLHVYSPHTTAGVLIQEGADPMVAHDLLLRLRELSPTSIPATATWRATPTPTSRPRWWATPSSCPWSGGGSSSAPGSRFSWPSSTALGADGSGLAK